jgi:2,5-furandicarboxylate decarboxylase 1
MITRNPHGEANVRSIAARWAANRLGVLLLPRHAHMFFEMAEARPAAQAAIVVGIDPLTLLASQAIVPIDVDEPVAALQRRPLASSNA